MKIRFGALVLVALLLSACAQTGQSQNAALTNLFVVTPQAPDMRYQLEIAKLNEIVARDMDLPEESQAELLYRRGSLYDALGLVTLARIDFNHALEYNPRLADAYNYLGIHYTQLEEFNYAYEMFDGVLELEPDHPYATLNRGVNAYYDNRIGLAVDDLTTFYEAQPDDPYRVIWLFLAEVEENPAAARLALAQRRVEYGNTDWGWSLVDLMLGAIDEQTFLKGFAVRDLKPDETLAERMCETYFYLGKLKQLEGDFQAASVYFRLAMSTNVFMFLEYRYANLELERSKQAIEAASGQ
ncbi:lipoprotein NlpI [Pseudidiomarina sp.]|uniref:lipoprotein NlpI n=1 Tax=Pseudidiomarina sp. TaxID=2081707 RepID=UPI003A974856